MVVVRITDQREAVAVVYNGVYNERLIECQPVKAILQAPSCVGSILWLVSKPVYMTFLSVRTRADDKCVGGGRLRVT